VKQQPLYFFVLCAARKTEPEEDDKMSWQDYVDKQLLASRCVSKAAIAGHDGNIWAKSEGFEVSTLITVEYVL
jgi:hypothetical protein